MRRIKCMISENPIFNLGLLCLVIAILAALFEYTIVTGIEVGTVEGKVYSISKKPFGGTGRGMRKSSFAKVKLATGEFIQVRCAEYCQLDEELSITVYRPLFSNELRYVYDRT